MSQHEHAHLRWEEESRERLLDAKVFSVDRSVQKGPQGREADYYLLNTPDWGNVVAVTKDDQGRECFIMVKQFRHGNMRVSLEFPGGVIDEGEDPREAAAREFTEETGYIADRFTLIGEINPNPAFMGNSCYTYLAEGVRPAHEQNLDENEVIDVDLVPLDHIKAGMDGTFFHAMMVVALHFYERHRSSSQ